MSGLAQAIAASVSSGSTDLVTGTVLVTDSRTVVLHQGVEVPARWLDPVHVEHGDSVLLAVSRAETGQSSALVLGRLTSGPRPLTGKVEAVAGVVASVATTSGLVDAVYTGAAPTVGDRVRLIWQGQTATVLGSVGAIISTSSPQAGVSAPAQNTAVRTQGVTVLPATSCGSWLPSGARWAGAVVQGTGWGTTDSHGGWGYGAAIRALSGVTVTSASIHLTGRNRSGAFNSPLSLLVSCHAQTDLVSRPEVSAPGWALTVPPIGGGWPLDAEIPTTVAQWLVDHSGGLMISDGSYGGLTGTVTDPTSGQVTVYWTR